MYYLYIYCVVLLQIISNICTQNTNTLVEQYKNEINKFINDYNYYKLPTDSRAYLNGKPENITSDCLQNSDVYDFIIVGAGSAGTVLANRLTEVHKWKVLLIEAGGEETNVSLIPGMSEYLLNSRFNWGYNSVPQKNSLFGYIDNVESLPRGKSLGGSSSTNFVMYARGHPDDFNEWRNLGNPGWSYKDVLPYFKKSEQEHLTKPDPGYHGRNGTLNVENVDIFTDISPAFLAANRELGRKTVDDYNGRSQGFGYLQKTTKNGQRSSGNQAFLKPILNRRNLRILSNTLVTKILIKDGKFLEAIGVQYVRDGKCYTVIAKKEVILSAGSINSPQLLMLSGIGPADELQKHKIPVKKHVHGVGKNMWDHVTNYNQPFLTNFSWPDVSQTEEIENYFKGNGCLTTVNCGQDIGFVNLFKNNSRPAIEYSFYATKVPNNTYDFYKTSRRITRETFDYVIKPVVGKTIWAAFTILLHPKSRGSVTLKTSSPFDFPTIDPNYFSDPEDYDINTLTSTFYDLINMSNTKAMQKFNSQILKIDLPSCRNYTLESFDHYKCLTRHVASTISHYSGTCKMGPSTDKMAVVDPFLRVYGVRNLRISDCSILPVTISGHNNAVAFMIGEKTADLIKQQYNELY